MDPDEQPHVSPDELTDEQRAMLEQVETQRRAAVLINELSDRIQAEARAQNRWIERNIWETDWTEVEVVDVVTLHPSSVADDPRPDLKVDRYAHAENAPGGENHPGDDVGYYGKRANRRGQVQRVTREEFRRLLDGEHVEVPEWLDVEPTLGGDLGPDDDGDEFDPSEALDELREERLDELDGGE